MRVDGDRIGDIRGLAEDPLSRGHICPKAVALRDVHNDPDRLRRPVRRTADGWTEIGWAEAFDLVADRLADIRLDHGANAVGLYLGNPVVHSLGALTHGLPFFRMLRTRNRYSATSVDQLPHQLVAYLMYGSQFLLPIPDIDRTRYFLVLGANPMASNGSLMTVPDFPRRLRELHDRGGRMVLFDPRRTETARVADEHHFVRPGTDAALLLAMLHVILAEGLTRPAAYVDGIEDVRDAVAPFGPDEVAGPTGVDAETVRRIAREFATAESAACYGRTGLSTQRFGALCQWAIQLLNVLTGNLDRPGGTLLTSPAVDGIANGALKDGHYDAWRSRVRGLPEFGGELPVSTLADEIRTPGDGQIRAMLTVAGNPVLSVPGGNGLAEALADLDFMVSVDFYVNETTRHADVILPPTNLLERDHYDLVFHMFAVRNTARYAPAVVPKPEGALHDWEIFQALAKRYHRRIRKAGQRAGDSRTRWMLRLSPARVVDLGLRFGPHRLSLRKLRRDPTGVDLGPLRPVLPARLRTPDKRVRAAPDPLLADVDRAKAELLSANTDTLVLVGRRHLRSNNSWMHNSERLVKGKPRHQLLMHPDDMAERGVADGTRVRVSSRSGALIVEAMASADMMRGVASLPHGYGHQLPGVALSVASTVDGASANDVTDPAYVDELGGTAALNGVPLTVHPAT